MNNNLEEIFVKAANSNLTPTAHEFVPRSTFSSSNPAQPSTSTMNGFNGYNNYCNKRDQRYPRGRMETNEDHNEYYDPRTNYSRFNNRSDNYDQYENRPQYDRNDQRNYYRNENKFNHDNRERSAQYNKEQRYSSTPSTFSNKNVTRFNDEWRPDRKRFDNEMPNQKSTRNGFHDRSEADSHKTNKHKESDQNNQGADGFLNRNYVFENNRYKQANNSFQKKSRNHYVNGVEEKNSIKVASEDSVSQRDRLIDQLNKGTLECLVCCDSVKQREPVWNCDNCYHVLHMWCVIKWAKSSKNDNGNWRCPACQNEKVAIPEKYMCFCGKTKLYTEWNRVDTAHSCGEMCGKSRENPTAWFVCEHRCTLLCHPGPCPSCVILVSRECGCGRTSKTVQCSTKSDILCGAICDRLLNCGVHRCLKTCHFGECDTCVASVNTSCYCGKKSKETVCGEEAAGVEFSCGQKCERTFDCGIHKCSKICHEGECGPCLRSPMILNTCACGKMEVTENVRSSCIDPVPTCGRVCGKMLNCGPFHKRHTCESLCHEGECKPCPKQTLVKCRCGAQEKSYPCAELSSVVEFKCQKKCNKKRSCGKHKCNQLCCLDVDHICPQRCSGTMNCGRHRCELLCHRGKCGRCLQSSFQELYCHCGHSVIHPPVPCGTKPPECDQPCKRQHECEHPPLHTCHSDRTCPPCIVFTDKLCFGKHELRKTIPCYQKEFSCGLPCGAPLPCGFHKCQVPCHSGDCLSVSKGCTQPCTKIRDLCGHACAAPCHSGLCPDIPCREMVKVTCACGNLVADHPCYEHADDYRRIISSTLAAKMAELQINNSVNISDINEKLNAQKINLRTLECNDECKFIMRNRRLALALQIQNPDLSAKLTPRYSDFMKSWAKKDSNLCRHVHDKLTALVKLAKESKQKSRSFSFEVMNKEKRQLVHEYCAHFGCESEAYDAEPKRNVVAIAVKGRCWLPAYSVVEIVQREMGQRKVPIPNMNKRTSSKNGNDTPSTSRAIILPILPSANSSHTGINYFGN